MKTVALILLCMTSPALSQPRIVRTLNDGWKFIREDVMHAEAVSYNDAQWETVNLPHTWNALDGQDGGNDYYRGVGWYRRHLVLDRSYRGKSLFLKFDAAATVADLFVNGKFTGTHKGGFGAFCFDVTSQVRLDIANVIAVRVSNAYDSTVAPLQGDFTICGGLYRGVHLLILNELSISPLDVASSGVYVKQLHVTPRSAEMEIVTILRNASAKGRKATLVSSVHYREGDIAGSVRSHVTLSPGTKQDAVQKLSLPFPRLWNGRNDPYLYHVIVELREGKNLIDRVVEPLGIRSFRVEADSGFFLNGRQYSLHGVNRHQDREGKGWAIGSEELREDYGLIEEIGATTVRLAHYQHTKEFYDLADQGGMIVWAELGLVDFVSAGEEFAGCTRRQLTELIKQNFNHPSIMFWSLSNELIPEKDKDVYAKVVVDLNGVAHHLDPTRLTTLASRSKYDGGEFINTVTDLVAYNVYKGWYEGMPEDFATHVDSLRKKFPHHRFGIGEYGAGACISHHDVPPHKPQTTAHWHPEEWQSHYHEIHWKAIQHRPFLWGSFVWNMFDFASDSRSEGELPGRNDKGLVTFDRKVKKDAFFWYKANWNPDPMVHITSRRFTPRPSGPTEVKVYSNCDSVALSLNGTSLGTKASGDRIFVWNPVNLVRGTNTIEAVGTRGGRSFRDVCRWHGQ